MCITNQFLRLCFIFGTNRISAILINGLRHQSEVSHNRNTGTKNALNRFDNLFTAFQLQCVGMALFHYTDGGSKSFFRISLIRTERHINHYHSTLYSTYNRLSMINHLIECNRKRSYITRHHIGSRVTDKNHIHPGTIYNLCHSVIVGSQHRYLLASFFHFYQAMCGHLSIIL